MVNSFRLHQRRNPNKPRIAMWLQYWSYDTKAECDTIIQFCRDHGVTDLQAIAVNSDATPKVAMGNSTLCNVTAINIDGQKPIRYLAREARRHGIRVHAWWCIYLPSWWIGANACLATPITDDDTADTGTHDISNGGSCINYHNQSGVRTPIINAIKDFAKQNPEVAGVNLDYIRTDGIVTFQTDADITNFVSETRSAIPDRILSICGISIYNASYPVHQDFPTWASSRYVDMITIMDYYNCYPLKLYKWDQFDLTKVDFLIGIGTEEASSNWEFNCTKPSDMRASLRQYSERGSRNFAIFDWVDSMDTTARQDVLDEYLHGRLQATAPYPALTKIVVTPATSIALDIGGTTYTTLYSAVTDHITTASLKGHIEGVEGQRPWIHYQRPENNSTYIRVQAGDWVP